MQAAVDAGMRVFTLSNGSQASARAFLERAGLADMVAHVLSVDDVQAWNPRPSTLRIPPALRRVPGPRPPHWWRCIPGTSPAPTVPA
ncbi:MAG: hypothetical protein NVSMB60_20610 [Mycobacterium sp.]